MTLEQALNQAHKVANESGLTIAVVNDPIVNNLEESPDGPYGYCPNIARGEDGKLFLFPYGKVEVLVKPD